MAWATVLVRYGEIGIKSRVVRARLERQLVDHLEHALAKRGVEATLKREWGRVLLMTPEPPLALNAARHTFGVVSASAAREFPATIEALSQGVREASPRLLPNGESFAVRVRRTGTHTFSSADVARQLGSVALLTAEAKTGKRPTVDLNNPEVEIFVEVRQNAAYLFTGVVRGPGGLPVGSQGKTVVVLDEPAAILAAWLSMRRGMKPLFVAPADAVADLEKPLQMLALWTTRLTVQLAEIPENLTGAQRRAAILDCASDLARAKNAASVVVSDRMAGALAYSKLDPRAGVPVFRPLLGYPGERFAELASQAEMPVPPPRDPAPVTSLPPEGERFARLPRSAEVWEVVL